ncbi:MAG: ATP-binding protein [Lachnospiraceae bacterium]
MRHKIQKSMNLVLGITLLLSFGLLTVVLYNMSLQTMKKEVKQETIYIETALNAMQGTDIKQLKQFETHTRLTLIDAKGRVLYDSQYQAATMKNHIHRSEIKEALTHGHGEALRLSDTLGKQTYYYAVILQNGIVLRVSKTTDTVGTTMLGMVPYMLVIGILMMFFARALVKGQVKQLIKPINELNLEAPLSNRVYEELTPLLESMEQQKREKEQAEQIRKEFSANVSHELKTPLTSISGYAEIMKDGLVKAEDIPEFSRRIYDEASRLIVLIEDIIKLSKLDEGEVALEKEEVDLYLLTREICSRLCVQAVQRGIHIEVTGEPVLYYGIRQILDEMIYNLCENAMKYNIEDGKVLVWVGNTLKGPKIVVTDTGIGIPEEHLERIFERFYRVDKSHSKERGGTGLGLSIVKHGASLHHAKVKVESKVGAGTKIEIQFCRD